LDLFCTIIIVRQMNKTQKQMLKLIHQIDATWGTDINNNNNDDDDDDEDYSHASIDNDPDL